MYSTTKHCYVLNIQALGLVVSKKIICSCYSYYKPLADNDAPLGVANLDPRGMVGRFYRGDYLTLLHTKYKSSGPHGIREENLFMLSYSKSIGAICCNGNQCSDPI